MTQRSVVSCVFALALLAGSASAQGINLALNDCGVNGATDAPANCTTNTGLAMAMVGSAVAPAGVDRMVACEGYIDAVTSGAFLTNWWQLDACRLSALTFNFDFTGGPFSCNDFWGGLATGGGGIAPSHPAPNRFRIYLVCATVAENPIEPGIEHYLFKVNILRAKSVGTGSCPGCNDAACLVLNRLVLNQPDKAIGGDAVLTMPMHANFVTYNSGTVEFGCPGATPAQNRSWGQVKGLYR